MEMNECVEDEALMSACKYQIRLIVFAKRWSFKFSLTKKIDRISNTITQNVQQENKIVPFIRSITYMSLAKDKERAKAVIIQLQHLSTSIAKNVEWKI